MLGRIRAKYKESGFQGILLAIVSRLPGIRAVCAYYVYRMPFSGLICKELPIENLIVVLADERAIEDLSKIQDKPGIFRERFQLGHHCFMAYMDGEPAAYLWWHCGTHHVEQRYSFHVPITDTQVFYYDSYTIPEKRKLGITRRLLTAIAEYKFSDCYKNEIVAIIETSNLTSLKAHEKIGFQRDSLNVYVKCNNIEINRMLINCK